MKFMDRVFEKIMGEQPGSFLARRYSSIAVTVLVTLAFVAVFYYLFT